MNNLINIKGFDEFVDIRINESLSNGSQSVCNQIFARGEDIVFTDGTSVSPKAIVDAVDNAIHYLQDDFSRTFKFVSGINIIFLRRSKKIKTMAVDKHMNLYINAGFVFKTLKMDRELIGAVIMHEVFHILFNHIERGKNWLAAKGKTLNKVTNHDNNLAADVEVNQNLVRLNIIDENRLVNEIKGMYLKNIGGETGSDTNVVPMEIILSNEKAMAKLRSMCPPEIDPENQGSSEEHTSEEWDKGYKDAWNKIAGLIKKYGYKKVWEKLQEIGMINGMGEIVKDNMDDLKAMEYLQVRSYEDFLNEGASPKEGQEGKYSTYDNGYMSAVNKIVERLRDAMFPNDEEGGDEGQEGGESVVSGVKKEDLDEIDIPSNNKGGKPNDKSSVPDNFTGSSSNDNDSDSDKSEKSAGRGGKGKSDDEVTDDDLNAMANDLKNRVSKGGEDNGSKGESNKNGDSGKESGSDSGNASGGESDSGAIGGTGSFVSDEVSNEVLKEAGYNDEEIEEINKIRKVNAVRNSEKGIELAREELKKKMGKSNIVARYLDAIDIESEKYKNIWKEIMEDFLSDKTRRAGKDIKGGRNDWKRKSRIAMGDYGINRQYLAQDPQDINVYVDVSGSVNMKLLEVISKALVIFAQEYEYSGINICPWASVSNGIYAVEEYDGRSEEEVVKEITSIISKGKAQCGGGTEAAAAFSAMIDVVVNALNDDCKDAKDDVHVVITDGYFDFNNLERRLSNALNHEISDREDVAELCPKNTFWMIYDAKEQHMEKWKETVKEGKVIFINSEVVIHNG